MRCFLKPAFVNLDTVAGTTDSATTDAAAGTTAVTSAGTAAETIANSRTSLAFNTTTDCTSVTGTGTEASASPSTTSSTSRGSTIGLASARGTAIDSAAALAARSALSSATDTSPSSTAEATTDTTAEDTADFDAVGRSTAVEIGVELGCKVFGSTLGGSRGDVDELFAESSCLKLERLDVTLGKSEDTEAFPLALDRDQAGGDSLDLDLGLCERFEDELGIGLSRLLCELLDTRAGSLDLGSDSLRGLVDGNAIEVVEAINLKVLVEASDRAVNGLDVDLELGDRRGKGRRGENDESSSGGGSELHLE